MCFEGAHTSQTRCKGDQNDLAAADRERAAGDVQRRGLHKNSPKRGGYPSRNLHDCCGERSHCEDARSQTPPPSSGQVRKTSMDPGAVEADCRLCAEERPQLVSVCDVDWRAARGVARTAVEAHRPRCASSADSTGSLGGRTSLTKN